MPSIDVSAGDDILAAHHNDLRADVIHTSTGHTHNGIDSRKLGTDVATETITRYYAFGVGDFVPMLSGTDNDWYSYFESLGSPDNQPGTRSRSDTVAGRFNASIHLPHGAIITSFKAYWYRTDAAATGNCALYRVTHTNSDDYNMASASSDSSAGYHSVEDTSIANATINNSLYYYVVNIFVDPNDDRKEVSFISGVITYTITAPLP